MATKICMDYLIDATLLFELLCFGTGLFFYKNNSHSKLKFTVVYIGIVTIIELVSYLLRINGVNNIFLYNILGVFEFCLFTWIYYYLITSVRIKKLIIILIPISIIIYTINGIFFSNPIFLSYLNFALAFKSLVITLIIMLYLFEIVKTEKVLYLKEIFAFWMSIGLLFFQVGYLPFKLLHPYLEDNSLNLIYTIQTPCSLLMYGSFSIGYIISKKENNIV